MRRHRFYIAILLITLAIPAWAAPELSKDAWMGVYLGPTKIGYVHTTLVREKLEGGDVYCLRESLVSSLKIEGKRIRHDSTTAIYFNNDFRPIRGVYEDDDNGNITRIEAKFEPGQIICKSISGGAASTKVVPIPSGADLSARLAYDAGTKTLRPGDEVVSASFDPASTSVTTETLRATRSEDVVFEGKKRSAVVIVHGSGRSEVTDWRLDNGELARSEMPGIGAVMVAQTRDEAMTGLDDIAPDLDVVKVDKTIANPRKVSDLRLRLVGVPDRSLAISDDQQSVEFSENSLTATYHIRRPKQSASKATLPVKDQSVASYLEPTEGIECRDGAIIGQSRKITSGDRNIYRAACKLCRWVQKNVRPMDDTSTALSAVDVLTKRSGCCRHNAVLYAALARAAGIPTKLAGGLIYDSGSFRFHVWAESWVGRWIPFDPTYPGDLVDATHVKLVEGSVEDLPALGRVAGRLRAEIIAAK